SVSDEPFSVAAGMYDFRESTTTKSPTQFSANFLTETSGTELRVVRSGIEHSAANKAYYRVVAVDEVGNRSGPSDYAAAPRPLVYSNPVTQAKTGADYQYDVRAIRAIGDLRTRVIEGREVMYYWDVEQPRFQL